MKFSTGIANELSKNDSKYFSVGINEDVKLESMSVKETPTGVKYISFMFTKEGANYPFEYSQYVPSKREGDIDDSKMLTKMANQITRFDKILKVYYPNDADRLYETDDYMDYLSWLTEKFKNADKTANLRIKLIYDDVKGFLTFPSYLKFDFIERMDVEKSNIAMMAIDRVVRPVIADKDKTEVNPVAKSSADDLPF